MTQGNENLDGKEALRYSPSQVEWATAEFIRSPPPKTILAIPYAAFICLVLAITGSYFLKIPISISGTGLLKPEMIPIPVMAKSNATVTSLLVTENQNVKKGQLLFTTDQEIDSKNRANLKKFLTNHRSFVARIKENRCNTVCLNTQKAFVDLNTSSSFTVNSTVKDLIDKVTFATLELIETAMQVDKSKFALREQYRQISAATSQLASLEKSKTASLLGPKVEQLNAQIGQAKSIITDKTNELKSNRDRALAKAEVVIKRLAPDIEEYQGAQEYSSPIDGYIWKMNLSTAGQSLFSGLELMQIIPESSELIATIAVKNEDISLLVPGMKTAIDLKALPEKEFETLFAKLEQVSPTAEVPKGGEGGSIPEGSKYLITARLEKQSFMKNGQEYKFRNGMELEGRVITKEERLLVLGFKKLLRLTDKFDSK